MRPKDCKKCLLHRSAFIICSVLSVIPIINLLATVASVVLSIIYLVGLYNAGKDINGCANAFVLSIISLVCNIISSLTSFNVLFAMLFSFAAAVLTFMVTYQVCTSVSDVVGSRGHSDIASLGKSTWIVFLIGSILNVVVAIVAVVIPFADVIIVGMSVVSTITPIFKFSPDVRKVIYMTNVIESLNSTYRKLNRQRSVLPSDTALLKTLYLATFEATKKWTMSIRNWGQVYGELSIMYEGRLPE